MRMIARSTSFCLLLLCLGTSGCVIGLDRLVGRHEIQGRLIDRTGEEVAGKTFRLVQARGRKADREDLDALFGRRYDSAVAKRSVAVTTDANGQFRHRFEGWLGENVWIIPPLFLLNIGRNEDRHGLVFLMETPDEFGHLYEINARKEKPKIRVYLPAENRFRPLREVTLNERIWADTKDERIGGSGESGFKSRFKTIMVEMERGIR